MKRWMIMAWCAAAAVAWGRGVPTYREYSREIEWGTESELSGEVGLDEARRLEARAAAAREDIVGTDRPLDLFRAGSSPFAQQGVKGGGVPLASDEGSGNMPKRKKKDSNWLLSELKLESMTTTNQAVLDGLRGGDDEEEGAWGWLADEVQGLGEEPGAAAEANEAPEGMNDMMAGMTERMPGTGRPGLPGTSAPERASGSGGAERGGGPERAADASGGTGRDGGGERADERMAEPSGMARNVPEGGSAMPEAGEMTRVKALLKQIEGDNAVGGATGVGGGMAGLGASGLAGNFAPDWDSLLKGGREGGAGGSVRDSGSGGLPGASAAGRDEGGGGAGWNAGNAGNPGAMAGWTGADRGGGGWSGGRDGGWSAGVGDGFSFGSGLGGTGAGTFGGGGTAGAPVTKWTPEGWGTGAGTGGSGGAGGSIGGWGGGGRKDWVETRPAGGGYRPAWD